MFLNRRAFLTGAVGAMAGRCVAAADPAPEPPTTREAPGIGYDDQEHTTRLFRTTPQRFAFRADSPESFRIWQQGLRERLRELLGLASMEKDVDFTGRAEHAETVEADGYTREKWYVWTEPDVPLPVWALIPHRPIRKPYPLVLTPHGHNPPEMYLGIGTSQAQSKQIVEGERDIAVQAAREGYLAILPTARAFGETRRADDRAKGQVSSCRTVSLHAALFGRTLIGCRVWDISRILDWAIRHYPVDSDRVAITGNSGGGTVSLFAPACDERIKVAVPSCYFCTFADSIGSIHHCECNYVPGLLREAEMYEVAGLIAPRPFCAIAGRTDPIFPLPAVQEAYSRLCRIYAAAGAEDRCELFIGDGGHRYYKAGSWAFIRRWFDAAR